MRAKSGEGVLGFYPRVGGTRLATLDTSLPTDLDWTWRLVENKEGKFVQPSQSRVALPVWPRPILPENLRAVVVPNPSGLEQIPHSSPTHGYCSASDTTTRKPRMPFVTSFKWCLQDGQRYASQVGYVPVPSSVAVKALRALNTLNSGG